MRWLLIAVTAVVFSLAASSCDGLTEDSGTWADPVAQGVATPKVTICHIPPGNPANAHTITVGAPAVPAHLRHGDSLGACASDGGDGGDGDSDGGSGGGGGGGWDGGDPGVCLPTGAECTASSTCCSGLACVDSTSNPCAADFCTCQVVVN